MKYNETARRELFRVARRELTPRRAAVWAGFYTAFSGVSASLRGARRLDDMLYPEWRDQKVEKPVFIFANGRSGTTMLHRLMSYDEESFAPFMLYQSLFNSVALQRAIQFVARHDRKFLGIPHKVVDLINDTFFDGWQGIHKMGIDEPEEDETTFALRWDTPTTVFLVPFIEAVRNIMYFDELPKAERDACMDVYEETLKRHLFSVGPDKAFLNKNIFHTPRIKSMLERFPDARFIYLVRHPYESVPSFLNLIYTGWGTHSPEIPPDSPLVQDLLEFPYEYYRIAKELTEHVPSEQLIVLRYEDLVADIPGTVERVYDHFGMDVSEAFRAKVEQAADKQRRYNSTHDYSLERFGLNKKAIYEKLRWLFDEFGYDSELPAEQAPITSGGSVSPPPPPA